MIYKPPIFVCGSCLDSHHVPDPVHEFYLEKCKVCGKIKDDCNLVIANRRTESKILSDFKMNVIDILAIDFAAIGDDFGLRSESTAKNKLMSRYKKYFNPDSFIRSGTKGLKMLGSIDVLPTLVKGKVKYIIFMYTRTYSTSPLVSVALLSCMDKIGREFRNKKIGFYDPFKEGDTKKIKLPLTLHNSKFLKYSKV